MERTPSSSVWHIISTLTGPYVTITAVLWHRSLRILEMIKSLQPVRLTQVIFDVASAVGSLFWDGQRTGPDFISPMSSLTKRQSGHLAKLLIRYSKSLPKFELESTGPGAASVYDQEYPQAVVVLDLNEIGSNEVSPGGVPRRFESQCTTLADADLMVLVPLLVIVLVSWKTSEFASALYYILAYLISALGMGPCYLTLFRWTAVHPTELDPDDGCAVLMDDDITVVIEGSQRIIEAITEGGFYFSRREPQAQPPSEDGALPITARWKEKQFVSDVICAALEGGLIGGTTAIPVSLLSSSVPLTGRIALAVFSCTLTGVCLWASRRVVGGSLPLTIETTIPRLMEWLLPGLAGVTTTISTLDTWSSSIIGPIRTLALVSIFWYGLFKILESRNYRIRTDRFLRALGRPIARKWPFSTRASAATFACLILCRDLPRPVKDIDVLGVLDTLIPNQRDIWSVWKARVADRIAHEERIIFAPTIPAFSDSRQWRLKCLLDEAQSGYDTYVSLLPRQQSMRE